MSTTYEVRVAGHLDPHWSTRLAGLAIAHHPDGTTTLSGPIVDQSQLHGVLTGLRDLAAPLLSVDTAVASPSTAPDVLDRVAWPRATERLTIRRAVPDDAEATFAFRRREEVARWLTELPSASNAYRRTFEDPQRLASTLVVESGGRVVGDLMLRVEDAWTQKEAEPHGRGRQAELAWVLDPVHTGHGYATEAVRELLHICFDDLGLHRVVATCFALNEPSWRLMERVGLRRELHARADALHRSGEWMDTYGYALTAPEWAAGCTDQS
jgi:RimJ/RimL family protein N-acetyltransferase